MGIVQAARGGPGTGAGHVDAIAPARERTWGMAKIGPIIDVSRVEQGLAAYVGTALATWTFTRRCVENPMWRPLRTGASRCIPIRDCPCGTQRIDQDHPD